MNDEIRVTGTIADSIRAMLTSDEVAAAEYLQESFLTEAMLALFHARRDAGLSQTQVAEYMGTKQSAIARWERDFSGSISLRKYVEFALACGKLPFDISLADVSEMRAFAAEHPGEPVTARAFDQWRQQETIPPLTPAGENPVFHFEITIAPSPADAATPPGLPADNVIVLQKTPQYAQRHLLESQGVTDHVQAGRLTLSVGGQAG